MSDSQIKVVCAWCQGAIGKLPVTESRSDRISHGICRPCADKLLSELGWPLHEYLNQLESPVLVIDEAGLVLAANRRASEITGKAEIEGQSKGLVFECAHAKLPEGCGRSVHCSGCTLRRAIQSTYETGKPAVRVPAFLKPFGDAVDREVRMVITTEKVGEVVLLRIDRLEK